MRNHVKGLEVVLPTGEIVTFGGKLSKNNAGYDIMQLIIGSEGTLGIVTKVMLKLYPEAKYSGTLLVSFDNCDQATEASIQVLKAGIIPLSIEYLDRTIALCAAEHLGEEWPLKEGSVDLMFILAENNEDSLYSISSEVEEICSHAGALEVLIADNEKDQARILNIRSNTYTSTKHSSILLTSQFLPHLCRLMRNFRNIGAKYNAVIDTVGHIGDGNVHNNIYLIDGKLPLYYEEMKEELYKMAVAVGGTITGEHGIGKTRRKNLPLQFNDI